jgi:hypothetical protein
MDPKKNMPFPIFWLLEIVGNFCSWLTFIWPEILVNVYNEKICTDEADAKATLGSQWCGIKFVLKQTFASDLG